MKMLQWLFISISIIHLIGCGGARPVLSNSHKGPYDYDTAPANILKVSVGILPVPKPDAEKEKPRMAWDLRDSIPNTLIKTLGAKDNGEAFMKLMAAQIPSLDKKDPPPLPTDFTQYKVLITFSNIKRYFIDKRFMHPNTRLEFLNIGLQTADNSNFSFYSIDKLVNEFEEIDLGSLERNKSVTVSAKLSANGELGSGTENTTTDVFQNSQARSQGVEVPVYDNKGNVVGAVNSAGEFKSSANRTDASKVTNAAKATAAAEASYLNTESIKEAMNVKLRRMKTGFSFSSNKIVISQRGRIGGDISDNVYVTATMKITSKTGADSKDVFKFTNLYGENGKQTSADKLVFTMRNVNYIKCIAENAVSLTTKYEGAVRAVGNEKNKTGESSLEFDDAVTYYQIAETTGEALKIDENVFCKKVYKITAKDDVGELTLRIAAPNAKELDLFSDDSPEIALQWIIDAVQNPSAALLASTKFDLYFERTTTGQEKVIHLVKDEISDDDIKKIKKLVDIKAVLKQ